jgi:Rieske Fe-S protein
MKISRREFFAKSAGAIVVVSSSGLISSIITSCTSPTAPTGNYSSLSIIQKTVVNNEIAIDIPSSPIVNKSTRALVKYNNGGSILVEHNPDDTYRAISGICTHQSCVVSGFDTNNDVFVCPCHGSRFDLNGNVVQGPAGSKLHQYITRVENNSLIITL